MDPTRCAQHYQPKDVKAILEASEGSAPAPAINKLKLHTPLYGDIEVPVWSDDKTGGHAMERHLLISDGALRERTLPGADPEADPGLPMASAFLSDKLTDLLKVAGALLNCERGQEGLSWLDSYHAYGKTRICIVEDMGTLGLPAVDVRIFYQGRDKLRTEKAAKAAIVVDSNIGGQYPIKIVTCFPCKDDPRLELNLSGVLAECRNLRQTSPNALEGQAGALAKIVKVWAQKQTSTIPDVLLLGNKILVGQRFNFGWITPNTELYKFAYNAAGAPVKDADDPYNKKAYELVPNGKPPVERVSLVMLQAAADALGVSLGFSQANDKKIIARMK